MADPEEVEIEGVSGQPITLPIANCPATGYRWELDLPDGVEQLDDGPPRDVPEAGRLGGAAGGNLRVEARAGDYVINARLARPWERDQPVRRLRIHLKVS
jgi:predicted secreted protein